MIPLIISAAVAGAVVSSMLDDDDSKDKDETKTRREVPEEYVKTCLEKSGRRLPKGGSR